MTMHFTPAYTLGFDTGRVVSGNAAAVFIPDVFTDNEQWRSEYFRGLQAGQASVVREQDDITEDLSV